MRSARQAPQDRVLAQLVEADFLVAGNRKPKVSSRASARQAPPPAIASKNGHAAAAPQLSESERQCLQVFLEQLACAAWGMAGVDGALVSYRGLDGFRASAARGDGAILPGRLRHQIQLAFDDAGFGAFEMKSGDMRQWGLPIELGGRCVAIICVFFGAGHVIGKTQRRQLANLGQIGAELIDSLHKACLWRDQEQSAIDLARASRERDAAERDSHAKTEFLSRISHELRTPLNAIIGFSHLALEHLPPQARPDLFDWIRSIAGAGDRLLAMVNQLLDIARIEQGNVGLEIGAVNIEECIAQSIRLARVDAIFDDIALSVTIGADESFVLADKGSVGQILTNLLSNAFKYNRAGGSIAVEVRANPENDALVDVSVLDNGIGIDVAAQAHLFEPFSRLGAERSAIPGNGLGLSISRALARKMRGDVGVTSAHGVGTRCVLTLPRAEVAVAIKDDSDDSALAGLDGDWRALLTVLYIEDDAVNQMLIAAVIQSIPGIHLIIASTGEEGILQANALLPDLVLLDMNLPDMHGNDVLARLRLAHPTRAIRYVALSADALPQQVASAFEHGAHDYWTKPINPRQLRRRIKALRDSADIETTGDHLAGSVNA